PTAITPPAKARVLTPKTTRPTSSAPKRTRSTSETAHYDPATPRLDGRRRDRGSRRDRRRHAQHSWGIGPAAGIDRTFVASAASPHRGQTKHERYLAGAERGELGPRGARRARGRPDAGRRLSV